MFSRVLIANRGEIALRIIRACKELGIKTVAVYSEADRNTSYLHLADDRVCIGPAPSAESYLNIPRIIAAAEIADVDAIHPGYGFLAENAHFADICRDCNIEFIGPSAENMRTLGDKVQAKVLAKKAQVPTTPDSIDAELEGVYGEKVAGAVEDAVKIAKRIGYPVVLKAAGGGGEGDIHFARNEATLKVIFKQAQAEAEVAFTDKRIYIGKKNDEGVIKTVGDAVKVANWIGYPVALKAAGGGGGRGIRFAHNKATLKTVFKQAQAEAEIAFGDGRIYMEKCLEDFRHIEVQILGDRYGNMVHLYERECSVQRRRQKVIEETPAPGLDENLRRDICQAAVRLAKEVNYQNAGTVEFILDANNNFYFMEVNTRIQVEHPITEMVTGVDLVQWQLRIAAGEKLEFTQDDIVMSGSAIECRINAEDPANNFCPSPGRIEAFVAPGGLGVRWDSHVYQGYTIPSAYDSLVGKLIVHRPTREQTIAVAKRALDEFVIEPTKTTFPLCREILSHEKFIAGQWDTTLIEREMLIPSSESGYPQGNFA